MVKDVIEGIKATEAEATGMIEAARKKKGEIVGGAREDGRKAVEEATRRGNEQVKQALDLARKDAEQRMQGIAADEKRQREAVKQAAAKNTSKAVEAVIERVLA